MDWYAVLALDPAASPAEIRKAYRRAALRYHPDKAGDADQFDLVSQAFQVLSDPEARAAFDAQQRQQRRSLTADRERRADRERLRAKLTSAEERHSTAPDLARLRAESAARRAALSRVLESSRRQQPRFRTLADSSQVFPSVTLARKHIDAHGGRLKDSWLEPEYSAAYERETIERLP